MENLAVAASGAQTARGTIEISVKGRWIEVPAYHLSGQTIIVKGKRLKIASLHDEDWLNEEIENPEECIRRMRESSDAPRADIFAFSQKVPHTTPAYSYPVEMRSLAVINLSDRKVWWDGLPPETRRNVRRAQKRGVILSVDRFDDELVKGIMEIQNESQVRQGRRYSHYGKSFEQVMRDHGSFVDRCDFVCAHYEKELIGVLKLVYRGNIASIMQLNSKMAHYDKRPANALVAKATELCEAKGIRYLTYELFNYGNKGDTPLRQFKVRNGFREMLIPSYYVPLTWWGSVCVKSKLYRGKMGLLPPWAIRFVLDLRTKWYDFRLPGKQQVTAPDDANRVEQLGGPVGPSGAGA